MSGLDFTRFIAVSAAIAVWTSSCESPPKLTGSDPHPPQLAVAPDTLDFDETETTLPLTVDNAGAGVLHWFIQLPSGGWISVSQDSGSVVDTSITIAVSIDRERAPAGFQRLALVVIGANGREEIPLIALISERERLRVSPTFLQFDSLPTQRTVGILNTGSGELHWQASSDQAWIAVSPDSGTVTGGSAAARTIVEVDRSQLPPGEHAGSVEITSPSGSASVSVLVFVPLPDISLSSREIDFGANLEVHSLEIANRGTGDLSWEFHSELAWLQIEPIRGVTGQIASFVRFSARRQDLPTGSYDARILLTSNSTADAEIDFRVKMQIPERPVLGVTPESLNFGEESEELSLEISNPSSAVLTWEVQKQEEWLEVRPAAGTTLDEPGEVTVTVDRAYLAPGTYTSVLHISSDGGEQDVNIEMVVLEGPLVNLSAEQIDFGPELDVQTLKITNQGNASLRWSLVAGESWIQVTPFEGELEPGQESDLLIQIVRDGLPPGAHEALLVLESTDTGETFQIPMTVTILQQDDGGSEGGGAIDGGSGGASAGSGNNGGTGSTVDEEPLPQVGDLLSFELPGGATMEFAYIEPGTFTMGLTEEEETTLHGKDLWYNWFDNERPSHEVTISQGFYLSKFEITQAQWESVMDIQPWAGQEDVQEGPDYPAVFISWDDVQDFIRRLNVAVGGEFFRLPTEAEWEYVCRAGTTTLWSFGDDERQLENYAWFRKNAWDAGEKYAHPVGAKQLHPWGLFDLHGNVWEWCQDEDKRKYTEEAQIDPIGLGPSSNRILRSGSFLFHDVVERSGYRAITTPGDRGPDVGARLLRVK